MHLQEGMTVKTVDGSKVGTVDRIVVDPVTYKITHIIVKKGFVFLEDRVIPLTAIKNMNDEVVELDWSIKRLETAPIFSEYDFIVPHYQEQIYKDWSMQPFIYYPSIKSTPSSNVNKGDLQDQDIDIVIHEGTQVISCDNDYAGHVIKVFADAQGKLTHILISRGMLFKTERLVPISWVSQLNAEAIKLHVYSEVVAGLARIRGIDKWTIRINLTFSQQILTNGDRKPRKLLINRHICAT